ncbi:PilZ domain-containing protein [Phycisphaerales bacterium AB-hyl4]|uniref:PilZ domain-containing protein n=1 Tax=Natronomicrosphaera hydrolytica TaxID=3242702 RepID=A0ABV4U345_9BACT
MTTATITLPPAGTPRMAEQRLHPRLKVPAMYTLMRARLVGDDRYRWTGHIYDISMGGMRFELDELVEPGTEIEFRAMLPGQSQVMFRAVGRVVRLHEPDATEGPVRMGMQFDRFTSMIDQRRLRDYLTARTFAANSVRTTRRAA